MDNSKLKLAAEKIAANLNANVKEVHDGAFIIKESSGLVKHSAKVFWVKDIYGWHLAFENKGFKVTSGLKTLLYSVRDGFDVYIIEHKA